MFAANRSKSLKHVYVCAAAKGLITIKYGLTIIFISHVGRFVNRNLLNMEKKPIVDYTEFRYPFNEQEIL